jgi:hypothetical protein
MSPIDVGRQSISSKRALIRSPFCVTGADEWCVWALPGRGDGPRVATFDWHFIQLGMLKRMPLGETALVIVAVACVVASHDLAIGAVVAALSS